MSKTIERIAQLTATKKLKNISNSNDEWYTPAKYICAVKKVFGVISLDPASCWRANKIIEAEKYFTTLEDGLKQSWAGCEKVFLNPPYSCTSNWINKLFDEYEKQHISSAILLTNTVTDIAAFQRLKAHQGNFLCCLVAGRIRFIHPNKTYKDYARFASIFTYLGNTETNYLEFCTFAEVFSQLGLIVK